MRVILSPRAKARAHPHRRVVEREHRSTAGAAVLGAQGRRATARWGPASRDALRRPPGPRRLPRAAPRDPGPGLLPRRRRRGPRAHPLVDGAQEPSAVSGAEPRDAAARRSPTRGPVSQMEGATQRALCRTRTGSVPLRAQPSDAPRAPPCPRDRELGGDQLDEVSGTPRDAARGCGRRPRSSRCTREVVAELQLGAAAHNGHLDLYRNDELAVFAHPSDRRCLRRLVHGRRALSPAERASRRRGAVVPEAS